MKQIEKLYYRISIYVVRDGVKYDSFVIGNDDEDLQVLFHCRCQFSEVRIPELFAKFVDMVSSSGGSNQNHQSVPIVASSSSTHVVVSSSLPAIVSAGDLVASPSFAADLHCDEIMELGAKMNTLIMIPISGTVGEPDTVEDDLGDDDDVEPATIDDDSYDNIGRSIPIGASGASSPGTQQYRHTF
ncbi:hypothetical protein Ahy_B02g058489 [Arachis hypogaea]|uniref:Uncharacterized protein n=1 Tax=Arachis hypogaea TaxID=3818 RepID=A0A445AEQ6_ARAHY|nr:hypothetical protein Ahy_B02g058489 [Arachis hypogaea]